MTFVAPVLLKGTVLKALMKTAKKLLFGLSLVLLLTSDAAAQTNVSFLDTNLQSVVLSALGKTNGPITTTDLIGLTNLSCWGAVTNLSGLEYATNLEDLRLYYGNPVTLAPLSGLPRLHTLALEHGAPQNLAGLATMTELTNLDLYMSSLTNISFLGGLSNLVFLDASFNRVADPSPLASLPRLQTLDLSGNPLGSGPGLANLTNISGTLYLDSASVSNIEPLSALTNLTELSLYQNAVVSLAPLSNLTSLTSLDLGYVPVPDFSVLSNLTNLQKLYVNATELTNLSRLPLLPRLTVLDATYNRVGDINALGTLTNLQWLNLGYNHVTNIDALLGLGALATVYLQVNQLDTNNTSTMASLAALQNRGVKAYYNPQHGPPIFSVPEQCLVPANETSSLAMSVADDLTPGEQLVVGLRSSNPGLVTAALSASPVLGYSGGSVEVMAASFFPQPPNAPNVRALSTYLNLAPVTGQTGTATITLTATDETGLTTAANLAVTIAEPTPFDASAAGISDSNLVLRTFGTTLWQGQTNIVHGGSGAAESGTLDSWLEASVTGPGLLEFWWRCAGTGWSYGAQLTATCAESGLSGHESLTFPGFGTEPPPVIDWTQARVSLPAGRWVLRWQANPAYFSSSNNVWVADIHFTPGPPPCWLETISQTTVNGFFVLNLHGPPGETYDLETSSDLHTWSKARRITLTDFRAFHADSAAFDPTRFYRMHRPVLAPLWLEQPQLDAAGNVQLTLHSEPQQPLTVECSTNLVNWGSLVQTNSPQGTLEVGDGPASGAMKFYRAKALPWGQLVGLPASPANLGRRHQLRPLPPLPIPH